MHDENCFDNDLLALLSASSNIFILVTRLLVLIRCLVNSVVEIKGKADAGSHGHEAYDSCNECEQDVGELG